MVGILQLKLEQTIVLKQITVTLFLTESLNF